MSWAQTVQLPDGEMYTIRELLTKGDGNAKMAKSNKSDKGYLTVGVSLAPANLSGYEMCPGRSKGCTAACLNTSGNGQTHQAQKARIAKTILLHERPDAFLARLLHELGNAAKRAEKIGRKLACRLNVFSDFAWEIVHPSTFTTFPNVQFYDYTKVVRRAIAFHLAQTHNDSTFFPLNYHLTFSRSEHNQQNLSKVLGDINVAVVFDRTPFPKTWLGWPVIDGNITDLRFLDPPHCIVGLTARGKGKRDESGFVIRLPMVGE